MLSVMLGLEVAHAGLAGLKSAVMAATVEKEEATVLGVESQTCISRIFTLGT